MKPNVNNLSLFRLNKHYNAGKRVVKYEINIKEQIMKVKAKHYLNMSNVCFIAGLVIFMLGFTYVGIIPFVKEIIHFIETTTFSLQDLVAIITGVGCIALFIAGTFFYCLSYREEEKQLEHEFRIQSENK